MKLSACAACRAGRVVAPLAGAWIEMGVLTAIERREESHPSRVRGLKCDPTDYASNGFSVAPLAGAWIEISPRIRGDAMSEVAPLAGAWIEMSSAFML